MRKRLILEFEFDCVEEDWGEYGVFQHLEPIRVFRNPDSNLSFEEMHVLGEHVSQDSNWLVDNWHAIQSVLGGGGAVSLE